MGDVQTVQGEVTAPTRRALTLEDMDRMRIPSRFREVTFGGVSAGPHREVLRNYLNGFDEMARRGVGLVLSGPNGTGKSSLAVVVAKEARRCGRTVLFVEAAQLKNIVFGNQTFEGEVLMRDRMRDVDVLVLDDVGKGVQDSVGAEERLLDDLIRHRAAYTRITILTTNLNVQPVRAGDPSQLERYLKPSTVHMLQECAIQVLILGADLRDGALDDIERQLRGTR
jgi:DNA replication protein DnaC